MKNVALIFAGGHGYRLKEADRPKQFLELYGKPVIIYTIELFEHHPEIDDIVVVCLVSWIDSFKDMLKKYGIQKVRAIVPGGETSQASIYNGLCAVESLIDKEEDAVVLIHDGVRPLIHKQTISDNIRSVREHGSCITCTPVPETIIVNTTEGIKVPHRPMLQVARAPQSFLLRDIISVHRKSIADGNTSFIDCCEMMHNYGRGLSLINGPADNIKITTISDYYVFAAMLRLRKDERADLLPQ